MRTDTRIPRLRRWIAAAVLASLPALAPAAPAAEEQVSFLSTPAGPVLLVVPAAADRPAPVVLALPDATGPDGRGRPYLERLNALGVATVEALGGGDDGAEPPGASTGGLAGLLAALSADPRLDAARLGVLAFGAAGDAALREPALAAAPAVLLYPGCARLPPGATDRPVLVLHGGVDRADPPGACARWAAAGGGLVRRHEYIHATYGWDFSDGPWSDGLALLPSPGAPGRRIWARSDPAITADAAARAADFLVMALDSAGAAR